MSRAASEFGVNRERLSAWLRRDGHEIINTGRGKSGTTFPTKDIVAAIYGDEEKAKIRDLQASANLKEQKHARLSGELVEWSEVERRVANLLGPIRNVITSARATLPAKCNPGDPHLAREAVEQWEESALALCHEAAIQAATQEEEKEEDEDDS